METENYQIDGKKGNWIATDSIIIDGKQLYLMEHQVYRDQVQGVILDVYGKIVIEECKKFDKKTKQKIHDYIQQQGPLNPVEQLKQDGKLCLDITRSSIRTALMNGAENLVPKLTMIWWMVWRIIRRRIRKRFLMLATINRLPKINRMANLKSEDP